MVECSVILTKVQVVFVANWFSIVRLEKSYVKNVLFSNMILSHMNEMDVEMQKQILSWLNLHFIGKSQ